MLSDWIDFCSLVIWYHVLHRINKLHLLWIHRLFVFLRFIWRAAYYEIWYRPQINITDISLFHLMKQFILMMAALIGWFAQVGIVAIVKCHIAIREANPTSCPPLTTSILLTFVSQMWLLRTINILPLGTNQFAIPTLLTNLSHYLFFNIPSN